MAAESRPDEHRLRDDAIVDRQAALRVEQVHPERRQRLGNRLEQRQRCGEVAAAHHARLVGDTLHGLSEADGLLQLDDPHRPTPVKREERAAEGEQWHPRAASGIPRSCQPQTGSGSLTAPPRGSRIVMLARLGSTDPVA